VLATMSHAAEYSLFKRLNKVCGSQFVPRGEKVRAQRQAYVYCAESCCEKQAHELKIWYKAWV